MCIRDSKNTTYDNVIKAMVLLKQAGIETVSLVTEPPQDKK